MRPKKRVVVMTERGELRFVLRHALAMTVSEEDGTGDDHPGRPFDLAILDARDGRMNIGDAAQRLAAIVGSGVPLLLLSLASQSTDGVHVNRVLHRELKGEGSMVGVLWAVRELTRRKRGPKPAIARPVAEQVVSAPLPQIETPKVKNPAKVPVKVPPSVIVNRAERMMHLAAGVA